jgi:hypothetical protein
VRIFKDKCFARFADKEGISDDTLRAAASGIEQGQWDADLGAGVYKQRIARPGEGKRAGYRAIIFFLSGERIFFKYGYPKSARDNISDDELRNFKKEAKYKFTLTASQIKAMLENGTLLEIILGGETLWTRFTRVMFSVRFMKAQLQCMKSAA